MGTILKWYLDGVCGLFYSIGRICIILPSMHYRWGADRLFSSSGNSLEISEYTVRKFRPYILLRLSRP